MILTTMHGPLRKKKNVTEKGNSNMNFWKSFKSEEIEFIDR
jgi:hypothetical protein